MIEREGEGGRGEASSSTWEARRAGGEGGGWGRAEREDGKGALCVGGGGEGQIG